MKELFNYCIQVRRYGPSEGKCLVELEDSETLEDVLNKYVKLRKGYWDKALIPELKKRFKEIEKQEKLLELYKELSKLKDDVIHAVMFGKDYEHLRVKTIKIEKQIKELENE